MTPPATSRSTKVAHGWQFLPRRKKFHSRTVRISFLVFNAVILGAILVFVTQNPHANATPALLGNTPKADVNNPLDQVSSADIALTVARLGSLPETTAITNQAQSQAADISVAASNNNVINKPQVVATALKSSADIQDYTAIAGDTIPAIATKFGVTSDSIRWSNNLTGDVVAIGAKLVIPPVNGIVYTVNANDTIDNLATKFSANKDKITAYNDAEIKGLTYGQRIVIPDAIVAAVSSPAPPRAAIIGASAGDFAWSGPASGSNGYDYGYCTWYVANRIPVPNNWGNANSWAFYASRSGWNVSKTPVAGSIAQTSAGAEGHVAVVESVSADGSMIKYSDMNSLAGWGRVGTTSNWVPAGHFMNYINH